MEKEIGVDKILGKIRRKLVNNISETMYDMINTPLVIFKNSAHKLRLQ